MGNAASDEKRRHVHVLLWPDEWESLHEVVSLKREKIQSYLRSMILSDLERNGKKKSEPRKPALRS
jgi:hypothetical protein